MEHPNRHLEFIGYGSIRFPRPNFGRFIGGAMRICTRVILGLDQRHKDDLDFKLIEDSLPKIAGILLVSRVGSA